MILVYLIAIAHVWSRGSIFANIRTRGPAIWVEFADCPLCSGAWIGMIGYTLWRYHPVPIELLGIGCVVATLNLAVYGAIRAIPAPRKSQAGRGRLTRSSRA